mmetsp:Transcript_53936/g.121148  ORF Transcript_53936/g.121148 Transcript_53936/m.121148 type:complete len:671 (-) Transcript_53936:8-2020(-)
MAGKTQYFVGQDVEIYSLTFSGWIPGKVAVVGDDGMVTVVYNGKQKAVPIQDQATNLRPITEDVTSPPPQAAGLGTVGAIGTATMLCGKELRGQGPICDIQALLKKRDHLKDVVWECFKQCANGNELLDVRGVQFFQAMIVRKLDLPVGLPIFPDPETQILRYDFTGRGALSGHEAYKMVFFHLLMFWKKELGGQNFMDAVPFKTPQQAGYFLMKELGKGSQGVAHLAKTRTGEEVCLKCIPKAATDAGGLVQMQEELRLSNFAQSPSILRMHEIFQDMVNVYMVADALYGGDFSTLVKRATQSGAQTTEDWWRGLLVQCLNALARIHEKAIMHCDVKEPNWMLRTNNLARPEVVLIDLGIAQAMATKNVTACGTPGYIPPETWMNGKWYPVGDLFSFGVCMVQMLTNNIPPVGARTGHDGGIFLNGCFTLPDIKKATLERPVSFHLIPRGLAGIQSLAQGLLEKDHRRRFRAPQALAHPWFPRPAAPESPKKGVTVVDQGMPPQSAQLAPPRSDGSLSSPSSPAAADAGRMMASPVQGYRNPAVPAATAAPVLQTVEHRGSWSPTALPASTAAPALQYAESRGGRMLLAADRISGQYLASSSGAMIGSPTGAHALTSSPPYTPSAHRGSAAFPAATTPTHKGSPVVGARATHDALSIPQRLPANYTYSS